MKSGEQEIIRKIVESSLDRAESTWNRVRTAFEKASSELVEAVKAVATRIPGYPTIDDNTSEVAQFVAMVVDIRDSTKHLMTAISAKTAGASQLERVLYELSASLPAFEAIVARRKGQVTEYLGDGLLALFSAPEDAPDEGIYAAYRSASACLDALELVINPILGERYRLPGLNIGIGLALSNAVVLAMGLPNFGHPKALGECVFYATKFSRSMNEVHISEALWRAWPKSSGAPLHFSRTKIGDLDAYRVLDERRSSS